jgi:electron-transferring-flavoprotein dehydrogenase
MTGGALIGCSAGFLNSVKMKGSHTAMKSGMLAAEAIAEMFFAHPKGKEKLSGAEITNYETAVYSSWIADELKVCRNSYASFRSPLGLLGGMAYTAFSSFITKGNEPWTIK